MTVPKPLAVAVAAGLALVGIGAGATGAPKQTMNPISLTTKKGPMVNGPEQVPPKPPSTTTTRSKPR